MWPSVGRGRLCGGGGRLFGRHRAVVVQSLRHQFHRQRVGHAARLLQLGALVLEPNLDLRLVQSELGGQSLPAVLGQVRADVELAPQRRQLVTAERRPRPLVHVRHAAAVDVRRRISRHVALATSGRLARPRTYNTTRCRVLLLLLLTNACPYLYFTRIKYPVGKNET